ncbi:MAG TPA: KH domain-containing protein [Actinomycetota bacterium]|nr:KH domain-containing protein [Actinomycetota bacterium]
MKDLLGYLARELVDDPDAVRVEANEDDRGVVLTLRVAQDDMGKVIGRGGRTARAIRIVMKAAGLRAGIHHTGVEIVD